MGEKFPNGRKFFQRKKTFSADNKFLKVSRWEEDFSMGENFLSERKFFQQEKSFQKFLN